ncbi:MAG: hypothetical protein ACERKN_18625 [Velocimicrobium sp.]
MQNKVNRILVLFLITAMIVNVASIKAQAQERNQSEQLFKAASDDTVVCYYMGYPIKKSQVTEDHTIRQSVVDSISNNIRYTNNTLRSNLTSSGANTVTLALPSNYTEAVIKQTVTAPRYSRQDTIYYLTVPSAVNIAQKHGQTIKFNTPPIITLVTL